MRNLPGRYQHARTLGSWLAVVGLFGVGCSEPATLAVSTVAIDFGEVPVGGAAHETVTLSLTSDGPAHLTVAVEPAGAFLVTDRVPAALSTYTAVTLPVAFQPTALGSATALLVLDVDAVSSTTRVDVALRGVGVDVGRDGDRDGVPVEEDCDDRNPAVFPGATEICDDLDNDCDGALPDFEEDVDEDGFAPCRGDCDDDDDTTYPLAPELCDGIDNDCDGEFQESDDDLDGFKGCEGDCDDEDPTRFPGAAELCNGLDDDCDSIVPSEEDDQDADDYRICEGDCADGNAMVNPGADELCDGLDTNCNLVIPADEVDDDGDFFLGCAECDDDDPSRFPGATEQCDGVDNDCDEVLPTDEVDGDVDGFLACAECDDTTVDSYPGAPELCDGLDNDCDTVVPTDETIDVDLDGALLCEDCDDGEAASFPGNPEVCDGIDNDCDDVIPSNESDDDGDGFYECDGLDCDDGDATAYVGAVEECYDAVDNDCDTVVNQGCTCPIWGTAVAGTCNGLGTYDCPVLGAQVALDQAAADATCDDTWLVSGTYLEELFVDVPGTLGAAGPSSAVVLDGDGGRTFEIDNTNFTIESLTITGGVAGEGAGLLAEDSVVTIDGVTFDANVCVPGGEGSAIFCDDCSLTVQNSTFTDNDCGYGGVSSGNNGGIHLTGGGSSLIEGNTFEGNTAGDGAAIWVESASAPMNHVIQQNVFYENDTWDTTSTWGEVEGGAVAILGNRVLLRNNIFMANDGLEGGGGVTIANNVASTTYVTNNAFVYNTSATGEGGGIHFESRPPSNNLSSPGIYGNALAWNTGWGIWAESNFPYNTNYNDYWQNTSGGSGSGNILLPGQLGSISVDPLFVTVTDDGDYTNDDFTLQVGSQCIDTGNPYVGLNDVDGSRNDIGAYGGPAGNW